jgi:hypothetical protein
MSREEIEDLLAALPTRDLDAPGERELLETLLAATPRPVPWWARGIPLWHAAAACLLAALLAAWLAPARSAANVSGAVHSESEVVTVTLDEPLFAASAKPAYRLDISKWGPAGGR